MAHIAAVSSGKEYQPGDVPPKDVAMILGARVYQDGTPSPFLRERLDLGADLLRAGKVRVILVSGSNVVASHRETDVMKRYLVTAGIPAEKVVTDPKGYDTFDSCVRARDVFGVRSVIVVSQGYHIPRAIMLCSSLGIDTAGVGGYQRTASPSWRSGVIREWFAGPKAEYDLWFGGTRDAFDPTLQKALES